jgi:hypothetical protein
VELAGCKNGMGVYLYGNGAQNLENSVECIE